MPPLRPTREHWGEWFNYIGEIIVERLKDSTLKYLSTVDDSKIMFDFHDEPLDEGIYVIPLEEPGQSPFLTGNIIEGRFVYQILVEGYSPDIVETDNKLRLILGDIIAELLNDPHLMYDGEATVRDLYITVLDIAYIEPAEGSGSIRRWHRLEVACIKKLYQATVTE